MDGKQSQYNQNSESDLLMLQYEKNHEETSRILEALLLQNEKNNHDSILDTMVHQNEKLISLIQNNEQDQIKKISDLTKVVETIKDAVHVFNTFLPKITVTTGDKGDKGDKGEKGDRGEKGDKPIFGVDFTLPTPQNGRDGKDAVVDYDHILEEIIPLIPKPKDGKNGKDGSPDTGLEIVKKLSSLEGKEKLSYDDLKDTPNLEYFVRTFSARDYDFLELKDSPSSYQNQAGKVVRVNAAENGLEFVTSSSTYTIVENEHPPESADGSRVNFTFLHTPITNSEKVYVGPGRMTVIGGDYTIAGTTITFTTPPPTDAVITFDYRY